MPTIPIRLLTAVPVCDGHDSAISTINLECIRHGIEVVYLGYHCRAPDIVRAATQEDVRAIGISSYNGGHVEFFTEVVELLRQAGAAHIGVLGGGGGTITAADAEVMCRNGVDRIFPAGTCLHDIVQYILSTYAAPRAVGPAVSPDLELARRLGEAEEAHGADPLVPAPVPGSAPAVARPRVIGITGPGGAGKTTLIDELVLRFLHVQPSARVAILSHDPSIIGKGALLGDRAAMIYCRDDRVFMRSLATRGQAGGLAPATERCIRMLRDLGDARHGGFDTIFVETVGTGQEAAPFAAGLVDRTVFVMGPDYGSRLQLQKIVMLDLADVVVVNKSDLAGAKTAASELEQRLGSGRGGQGGRPGQQLISTVAKRHRDGGVDALFEILRAPAAHSGADDGQSPVGQQGGGVAQPVRAAAGVPRPQRRGVPGAAPEQVGRDPFADSGRHHADRPAASSPGAAADR